MKVSAESLRDTGMARALDHAERVTAKWGDLAYAYLVRFAATHEHFISEDVSDAFCGDIFNPLPPSDRAWGAVYTRAVRSKVIVQDGAGRSRRRHASICPRWRSLRFGCQGAA